MTIMKLKRFHGKAIHAEAMLRCDNGLSSLLFLTHLKVYLPALISYKIKASGFVTFLVTTCYCSSLTSQHVEHILRAEYRCKCLLTSDRFNIENQLLKFLWKTSKISNLKKFVMTLVRNTGRTHDLLLRIERDEHNVEVSAWVVELLRASRWTMVTIICVNLKAKHQKIEKNCRVSNLLNSQGPFILL